MWPPRGLPVARRHMPEPMAGSFTAIVGHRGPRLHRIAESHGRLHSRSEPGWKPLSSCARACGASQECAGGPGSPGMSLDKHRRERAGSHGAVHYHDVSANQT